MTIYLALFLGALCGLLAAMAMNLFMRAVGRQFGRSADMVRALGSYFTGGLKNASAIGTAIHSVAGIVFGMIYFAIMHAIGALAFPKAILLGLGLSFAHGLITSYILMIYASRRHPLENYRKATIQEGVLHMFGHLIFGAVIGVLAAIAASVV